MLVDVTRYPQRVVIDDPQTVRDMLELVGGDAAAAGTPATQPPDPELLEALRALGYVQ